MNPILIFTIATIVNVSLSTIRALCTIKGGKMLSAVTNAVCYGFYPLVIMLTAQGTVSIVINMAITAIVNFVCVYLIKMAEEKARKDKLWKVEATIPHTHTDQLHYELKVRDIPHNFIENVGQYTVFNIYCETQKESAIAKVVLDQYQAKYFVSESKTL